MHKYTDEEPAEQLDKREIVEPRDSMIRTLLRHRKRINEIIERLKACAEIKTEPLP